MVQNTKELHMFNIGDVVKRGNGKVEYVVASVDGDNVTVESLNTGKPVTVDVSALSLLRAAETEPMNVPLVDMAQVATEAAELAAEHVRAEVEGEEFDPRKDRRQSAYGLSILGALMRKGANNPRQFAHNSNPLKSVSGKRAKVRNRVKGKRHTVNVLHREYNRMVREQGYNIAA